MKLTVLGSNGWYPSKTGNTSSILLETNEWAVIFDAGNGLTVIEDHLQTFDKPIFLLLSHFHLDHISALHVLAKYDFPQGLTIVCHSGGKALLDRIITQPFTKALSDHPFPVRVKELEPGLHDGFPFQLSCAEMVHSARCFGYRLEYQGRKMSYCTDTGPCQAMIDLSKSVDLMITECSHKPGQDDPQWPHLNPENAADIANKAGVKSLLLTHFEPRNYPTLADREKAANVARKHFMATQAAVDGFSCDII